MRSERQVVIIDTVKSSGAPATLSQASAANRECALPPRCRWRCRSPPSPVATAFHRYHEVRPIPFVPARGSPAALECLRKKEYCSLPSLHSEVDRGRRKPSPRTALAPAQRSSTLRVAARTSADSRPGPRKRGDSSEEP